MKEYFRKIRFLYNFDKFEKLYNTATVLVFTYASAWYEYAPHKEQQEITHGDMRDMRTTATGQIVSYLLGRDYTGQGKIIDKSVKERSLYTRSYVPVWADEIMNQDILFNELLVQTLICGNYFAELEPKHKRQFAENVDLGTAERRKEMIEKYGDPKKLYINFKKYNKLVEQFSEWDDRYYKLKDEEKNSLAGKEQLFLESKKVHKKNIVKEY